LRNGVYSLPEAHRNYVFAVGKKLVVSMFAGLGLAMIACAGCARTRAVVQRELAGAISLACGAGNSWSHLAVAGLPAEGAGMSRRACALRRKGSRPQPPCSHVPQGELARATTEH